MDFQYISLGNDCSSARTLKDLHLRTCAHPFDWTETSFEALSRCLKENFSMFHKNVHLDEERQNVVDEYGIKFSHDYPVKLLSKYKHTNDGFQAERLIEDGYEKYIDQVREKYGRRIERFRNVMADKTKPIIVLYRDSYENAVAIKKILEKTYNREHLLFVVATTDQGDPRNLGIITCNPDVNEKWNNIDVWLSAIQRAKQVFTYLTMKPATVTKRFSMNI